jgi:hypothetical protein
VGPSLDGTGPEPYRLWQARPNSGELSQAAHERVLELLHNARVCLEHGDQEGFDRNIAEALKIIRGEE